MEAVWNTWTGGPGVPAWLRLMLAFFGALHSMLCVRVIVVRAWRKARDWAAPTPERVPTAAMLAYAILTANMVRVMVYRIPAGPVVQWETAAIYAAALVAGTVAFTQIVYLTHRSRRHAKRTG